MLVSVPKMDDVYTCHWGASLFFEGVPFVEFMYPVFTRLITVKLQGARIACRLERWSHDGKVGSLNPVWSSGRIVILGVNFVY